jgi:acetyl-CoA C-acetyltransferase
MSGSVILAGARTPIGKLSGALSSQSATDLGALAIAEALRRAHVAPERVDYLVMGQVLQAGQGGNAARLAGSRAGLPMSVASTTINKMCLSGMNAIHLADLMIRSGEAEIVVAGGMESMTHAPYQIERARSGLRFGNQEILDTIMQDGLLCAFEHQPMGAETERYAGEAFTRDELDLLALNSHRRAAQATREGRLRNEIVPVMIPQRSGSPMAVDEDEGIRSETSLEALSNLTPAFSANGTITAGNASQISDGAAAIVVVSRHVADSIGIAPLGELIGYGQVAGPDTSLLTQPSRAIRQALAQTEIKLGDIDLFEINEAFATVALASMQDLGIDTEVVNVNGGAIAFGHPIGMSGARLVLTLAYELGRRGAAIGAAALCGGGGQGDALLLRAIS